MPGVDTVPTSSCGSQIRVGIFVVPTGGIIESMLHIVHKLQHFKRKIAASPRISQLSSTRHWKLCLKLSQVKASLPKTSLAPPSPPSSAEIFLFSTQRSLDNRQSTTPPRTAPTMPKSKRAKVVHLTKVDKKGKDLTLKLFSNVQECLDTYQYCFVFSVENMRNTFLKQVRADFPDSRYVSLFLSFPRSLLQSRSYTAKRRELIAQ